MTGPRDLRGILESYRQSGKLTTLTGRLDPYLEAAARVREAEPSPVLLERLGVAANLLSTRDELAAHLGVDPTGFLPELSRILAGKSAGLRRVGGCFGRHELAADRLERLPALTYYQGDGGPYVTAGVWIVRDPVNGRNLSYHRMMLMHGRRAAVRVVERRGTDTALRNSGGRLEAAVCIGAPAHVLFAASLSPAPGVDELQLAAKFGAVELVRCKTVDLEVPAGCEMVIEGAFTGEKAPEGPFVDITGTMDFVREQPVFEVSRVACRKDPVHYAIVPGRADHRVLMGIPKELDIYRGVSAVCDCLDVAITSGGCCWLHAVVRIRKRRGADGKKALHAAFAAHRSLKGCVVVDEDIDPRDPAQVEWALATRFQADKDLLVLKGMPSSSLDPSARHVKGRGSVGAKLGMDATVKSGLDRSLFRIVTA
jgi:UbiD family decarboxylase